MDRLPYSSLAAILLFAGEASPTAAARAIREAVPLAISQLAAEKPGVAAFLSSATAPASLADALAAGRIFPHDEILGKHFSTRRGVVTAFLRAAEQQRAQPQQAAAEATTATPATAAAPISGAPSLQAPTEATLATTTEVLTAANAIATAGAATAAAGAPNPQLLTHFAAWLFERIELDPLVRSRRKKVSRMLSFGIVQIAGFQRSWVVSKATTDAAAQDLLRTLQAVARAQIPPDFPFYWIHISREATPRQKFSFARDAYMISLPDGRSHMLAAGEVARAGLLELETVVSFNAPVAASQLPADKKAVLENAGFVVT